VGALVYWLNRALGRIVGADTVRRAPVGDYTIALPIGDAGLRLSYLLGSYEPDVEQLTAMVLRAGDIAVDVGTNIGWHTLRFASKVGPGGRVFSFEPGEGPRSLLWESLRINDWTNRVTLSDSAVSDNTGTARLYPDGASGLMSSVHAHSWLGNATPVSMSVTTLYASVLPQLDRAPRLPSRSMSRAPSAKSCWERRASFETGPPIS